MASIEQFIGFFDCRDRCWIKSSTTQAFGVDTNRSKGIASTNGIGGNILADGTGATYHAVRTNPDKLMHCRQATQHNPVSNMNMACQLNPVRHNGVATNLAIVGDMNISHNPVIVRHPGGTHILYSAGIDGDIFPYHVAVADGQVSCFALIFFILRVPPYGAEAVEGIVFTN